MRSKRLVVISLLASCFVMITLGGCTRINIQNHKSRACNVVPFSEQSEVQHVLNVVSLRGDINASGDPRKAKDYFKGRHAETLLAHATKVAQEGQKNDFACKIKLTLPPLATSDERVPEVEPPPYASACVKNGDICTEDDFNMVIDMQPPGIKLVNRISWCGVRLDFGTFYGCSKKGGHSIIVESDCQGSSCPRSEAVLWLHELGHTMGLPDRPKGDRRPAVMRGRIDDQNNRLTKCDCMSLRKNLRR